jgi:hypothetical protein
MKKFVFVIAILCTGFRAAADDAALKVDGDLMIHPAQTASFFTVATNQIKSSTSWSWPALQFTKPYKTSWSKVQAVGPFDVAIDSSTLANQDFTFTMTWQQPAVNVGQFEIHDTVVNNAGGVTVVFHLDGTCSNMVIKIPSGQWIVRGKLRWDLNAQALVASYEEFSFQMNTAAVPQIDVGQCSAPAGLIQALHDSAVSVASSQPAMQDLLKAAILDWSQNTLNALQAQLLTEHHFQLKDKVTLSWQPSSLASLAGGLMRVLGTMMISKAGATAGADSLARNYNPATVLPAVKESGFVLPKDTLQRVLNYLYTNGELQYRVASTSIASFTQLLSSGFEEFWVWPDLMNFSPSSVFYFDVGTQHTPQLGAGAMLDAGGSSYPITAPMIVHQWAPAGSQYLPYFDFSVPISGQLSAVLSNGQLNLQLQTQDLQIVAQLRDEYLKYRPNANPWIGTSMISSSVQDYLNSTPYTVAIPDWQLAPGIALGPRDIQVWTQTFRIPLQIKTTP